MEESMYVHELAGQLVQQHRCSGLMESVACCTITERRRKYVSILRSRLHLDGRYTILSFLLCVMVLGGLSDRNSHGE